MMINVVTLKNKVKMTHARFKFRYRHFPTLIVLIVLFITRSNIKWQDVIFVSKFIIILNYKKYLKTIMTLKLFLSFHKN